LKLPPQVIRRSSGLVAPVQMQLVGRAVFECCSRRPTRNRLVVPSDWPMRIFVGLALALLAFSAWWIRRLA
jgi:hypothetical protein